MCHRIKKCYYINFMGKHIVIQEINSTRMLVKKSACVMRTTSAYRGKIKDLACKRNSRI